MQFANYAAASRFGAAFVVLIAGAKHSIRGVRNARAIGLNAGDGVTGFAIFA
jgi:hypothetical protein